MPRCIAMVFEALFFAGQSVPFPAPAGPPLMTDDPVPIEYKDCEIIIASPGSGERSRISATATHFEKLGAMDIF